MGLFIAAVESTPTTPVSTYVTAYPDSTSKRWASKDDAGAVTVYPYALGNASVSTVSAAYASDTYLAGSSVTIPTAGDWKVAERYRCTFDMTKTGAGTAAFTLIVRMGTAGTTADAAILTLAFAVGTAAVDTGMFDLWVNFQTVGSGTSAVIAGALECRHALAATGLITTGASGIGLVTGTSSGFNSTTQTVIGVSVNGGTSFSGTNTLVQARLEK